jgi:hypothetical protein
LQADYAADRPPKPSGKARLLTLNDLDRRTAAYQATARLISEIEADLGGHDRLSTAERQLVQRAAVLGAVLIDAEAKWLAGDAFDPSTYCAIVNAQRRVLETIGLKRRARDVSPLAELWRAEQEERRRATPEALAAAGGDHGGGAPA